MLVADENLFIDEEVAVRSKSWLAAARQLKRVRGNETIVAFGACASLLFSGEESSRQFPRPSESRSSHLITSQINCPGLRLNRNKFR